jgi:hypothetical protein
MNTLEPILTQINHFCNINQDIMNIIISYTYSYQPPQLLEDIISYIKTKKILHQYYKIRYASININLDNIASNDWFYNDIWWHLQDGLTSREHMFLLLKNKRLKTYRLYSKLYKFLNAEDTVIYKYLHERINKCSKNINLDINIIWGLLTPNQRQRFIDDNNFIY